MFTAWKNLAARFDVALDALGSDYPARVTDLRASSLFFFALHLQQRSGLPLLLVTETTARAARMQQFLVAAERLINEREPAGYEFAVFPDFEPQNLFEYFDPPLELLEARGAVLDSLRPGSPRPPRVIVTSYKALFRMVPEPEAFFRQHLDLAPSAGPAPAGSQRRISRDELARQLELLGYRQVSTVTALGEYALRGGLVDVFPVGEELPLRVDLFGDEIESIQRFSPETQRSTEPAESLRILPIALETAHLRQREVQEWLRERWDDYRQNYREQLSRSAYDRLIEVVEQDLELLAAGGSTPRAGWYYQATCSNGATLWDYLPEGAPVLVHEDGFVDSETSSYFRFWQNRFSDWLSSGLSFLRLEDNYVLPAAGIVETMQELARGRFTSAGLEGEEEIQVPAVHALFSHAFGLTVQDGLPHASVGLDNPPAAKWGTARIVETVRAFPRLTAAPGGLGHGAQAARITRIDRPLTVLTQFSARLRELLHDEQLYPEIDNAILPGGFVVPGAGAGADRAGHGATLADAEGLSAAARMDWTVITDVEIFGEIAEVAEAPPIKRYRGESVRRPDELNPGDYVVHIDYGIGRFAQLTDRNQSGVTKSYVEVEYAGRDRLFVPVEQLDRLRRYSFDGSTPQLNNLGREQWKKTKEKVAAETLELAKKLLALYKTRQVRSGHAYVQHTTWEDEFAEGFPYELTGDQMSAWRDVEQDMESPRPMDRLLCGDVGFGKTEIAMRAAFKACVDERQVLVLCPTTVLADQHFHTFTQRFRPFPFRVGILSRFQGPKEQKETVEMVKDGRLDVLIATHRGLSKDVEFKRLGLMVIDEEQRFGVKQKEKLKMRFPLVDVLAMSATPIPRTLHMSLIGLRDISLIETAPVQRKPVKTYVGEYDNMLVREALLRELGRGGQVYYLHNRVQDIERVKAHLEYLVPGEKIIIAHGQMKDERLEEVMHAFSLGAYKIMLATTIIENGLDIPSVNTIILDHAENLGLAQMHQLRGRVGRSSLQAYAYFFHDPQRVLTEESQSRLHAIYNYAYLGAGYEIAQSDLRIRGAGNLLGAEQSGLAKAVGFEYYCEMLARTIRDIKELSDAGLDAMEELPTMEERPGTQIDLPLPCFIPADYIDDPVLRLEVLRDLAALESDQAAEDFELSLLDRFGELPQQVGNLLLVIRLRNLGSQLALERVAYNRAKDSFTLKFFDSERDWFKRSVLLDSRFSPAGPQLLELKLEFKGIKSAEELHETLSGLLQLRPK
ncbi:transcription-repair coupling factor [bacterium]|nr:transcription-repair coupling factor [bacterium]